MELALSAPVAERQFVRMHARVPSHVASQSPVGLRIWFERMNGRIGEDMRHRDRELPLVGACVYDRGWPDAAPSESGRDQQ